VRHDSFIGDLFHAHTDTQEIYSQTSGVLKVANLTMFLITTLSISLQTMSTVPDGTAANT